MLNTYALNELGASINGNTIALPFTEDLDKKLIAQDGYIVELEDTPVSKKFIELRDQGFKADDLVQELTSYENDLLQEIQIAKEEILVINANIEFRSEFTKSVNGFSINGKEININEIEKIPGVKKVHPNYIAKLVLMDSVPIIRGPETWQLTNASGSGLRGQGIRIAVIDTGVDYTHSDLGGCFGPGCKIENGYDFYNDDNDPMDDHGHGTHVTATIAGDGILRGIAPRAKIYAYKVCSDGGGCPYDYIIDAIESSIDPNNNNNFNDHVDVMSISLGGPGNPDDLLSQSVDNAVDVGIVAVVAAGNSGPAGNYNCRHGGDGSSNSICSPGTSRKAITIGASCKPFDVGFNFYCDEDIAGFSSRGPVIWQGETLSKPDVVAPGVEICAAQWEDAWQYDECLDDEEHTAISGTSMATPHVAGVAALVKQAHPDWTPNQVKESLKSTAEDLGYDEAMQGQGLVVANDAVAIPTFAEITPLYWDFYDTPTERYWDRSFQFGLRNRGPNTQVFNIGTEFEQIGITSQVQPVTITLNGFQEGTFLFSVRIDHDLVPSNAYYYGDIVVSNPNNNLIKAPIGIKVDPSIISDPVNIDLGIDTPSLPTWSSSRSFSIQNLRTDRTINLNLDIECCSRKDIYGVYLETINFDQASLTSNQMQIGPGSSFQNSLNLQVDNSDLSNGIYEGKIIVSSAIHNLEIPFTFVKFYLADTTFPIEPVWVWVSDGSSLTNFYSDPGSSNLKIYLDQPGVYDIYGYESFGKLYGVENVNINSISNILVPGVSNRYSTEFTDEQNRAMQSYGIDCVGDSIIINKFVPRVSMWIWWFGCPLNGLLYQAGNLNEMNYGHAFIVLPQNNPDREVYYFNANVTGLTDSLMFNNRPGDLRVVNFKLISETDNFRPAFKETNLVPPGGIGSMTWFPDEYQNEDNFRIYLQKHQASMFHYSQTIYSEDLDWQQETALLSNENQKVNFKRINYNRDGFVTLLSEDVSKSTLGLGPDFWFGKVSYMSPYYLEFHGPSYELLYYLNQDLSTGRIDSSLYTLYKNGLIVHTGFLRGYDLYSYSENQGITLSGSGSYNLVADHTYKISNNIYGSKVNLTFSTNNLVEQIPSILYLRLSTNDDLTESIKSNSNFKVLLQTQNANSAKLKISYVNREEEFVMTNLGNGLYTYQLTPPIEEVIKLKVIVNGLATPAKIEYEFEIPFELNHNILNPSYEVDSGIDYYPSWTDDDNIVNNLWPDGHRTTQGGLLDGIVKYQGSKSLKLLTANNRVYSYQDIPVEYNKKYRVSGYIKTDCIDNNCYGTIISECKKVDHSPIWDYSNCKLNINPVDIRRLYGDNNWAYIEFDVENNRQDARFLRVLCYNTPGPLPVGSGVVWCDSMNVIEIPRGGGGGSPLFIKEGPIESMRA